MKPGVRLRACFTSPVSSRCIRRHVWADSITCTRVVCSYLSVLWSTPNRFQQWLPMLLLTINVASRRGEFNRALSIILLN